jgi:hypothetical protein
MKTQDLLLAFKTPAWPSPAEVQRFVRDAGATSPADLEKVVDLMCAPESIADERLQEMRRAALEGIVPLSSHKDLFRIFVAALPRCDPDTQRLLARFIPKLDDPTRHEDLLFILRSPNRHARLQRPRRESAGHARPAWRSFPSVRRVAAGATQRRRLSLRGVQRARIVSVRHARGHRNGNGRCFRRGRPVPSQRDRRRHEPVGALHRVGRNSVPHAHGRRTEIGPCFRRLHGVPVRRNRRRREPGRHVRCARPASIRRSRGQRRWLGCGFRRLRRGGVRSAHRLYDGQGYWLCHKRLSSGRFFDTMAKLMRASG